MRASATARFNGFAQTLSIHSSHARFCQHGRGTNYSRQWQRSKSTQRGLAFWTKITAAPGDNAAPDPGLASVTGFSLAAVSAMATLIFPRLAFGIEKIGYGGTAHRDGFAQNLL